MRKHLLTVALFVVLLSGAAWSHHLTGLAQTDACLASGYFNCGRNLTSAYSSIFGIPISILSAGFFVFLAAHTLCTALGGHSRQRVFGLPLMGAAAAGVVAVFLLAVSVFVLHSICLYCAVLYGLIALTGAMSYAGWRDASPPASRTALAPMAISASCVLVYVLTLVAQPHASAKTLSSALSSSTSIHVMEFFDFECPACKQSAQELEALQRDFPTRVAIEYVHYPLCSECNPDVPNRQHEHACLAAKLAIVMESRGKGEAFRRKVLAEPASLNDARLFAIAGELGETEDELRREASSDRTALRLRLDLERGRNASVRATPMLLINGHTLTGAAAVAQLRAALSSSNSETALAQTEIPASFAMEGHAASTRSAPPWTGILDSTRAVDWSLSGVKGGIPTRTTLSATINATTYGTGATDATAAIQTAINNCPANDVVFIPAGTYTVAGDLVIDHPIVIRGAGANKTTIALTGRIIYSPYRGSEPNGGKGVFINWTAGYTKGSTVLTLASVAGLNVGQTVVLDQHNDPNLVTLAGEEGTQGGYSRADDGTFDGGKTRCQGQINQIVAINAASNQITLEIPLYYTFQSALAPQVFYWPGGSMNYAGIETLKVDATNTSSRAIEFNFCDNCWVKGVEIVHPNRAAVGFVFFAYRPEIRDSYLHDSQGPFGPTRYGVELGWSSAGLMENNIISGVVGPLIMSTWTSGMVAGYNYITNDTFQNGTDTAWQFGAMEPHICHTYQNLFEGNNATSVDYDDVWGSASHSTTFRNRFPGYNGPDGLYINNTTAVRIDALNHYMSVVGNVLGYAGWHQYYELDPSNYAGQDERFAVYKLGLWDYMDQTAQYDPQTKATVIRGGNYDVVSQQPVWRDNVPSGEDATTYLTRQALPASFYRNVKPGWWNTASWPAIGPDVTSGSDATAGTGSPMVGTIPAQACYAALNLANGGTFNPATCYPSDFGGPLPLSIDTASLLADGQVGVAYSLTFSASGGSAPYAWSVSSGSLPAGLNLNAAGAVSGMPTTVGSASFTVKVTDNVGASTTKTYALTIDPAIMPPRILSHPTATPNPTVTGQSVAFSVSASDPQGLALTYAWTFGDGSSGTGSAPSHTYASAGQFTASVTVTNLAGRSATDSVTVVVSSPPAAPVISSATTASGKIGTAFSYSITASNSPLSFGATGLPAGLNIDTHSGVISGTPAATGVYSVGLSATNAGGTGTMTLQLTVVSGTNPMTVAKTQGSVSFTASGHDSYSITGVLPSVPMGFSPAGKAVVINLSGAAVSFKLNKNGGGTNASGSIALKFKTPRKKMFAGGNVSFLARVRHGTWSSVWNMDPSASVSNQAMPMSVTLQLDGVSYQTAITVKYSAKAHARGHFKQ